MKLVKLANRGAAARHPFARATACSRTAPAAATRALARHSASWRAFETGVRLHVYVDETRPLLQGGRLTTWELGRLGIPYTLLTDSMAAILMREGRVQRVLVGADRVARNGDVANKIGTYALAIAAHHHDVPFYVWRRGRPSTSIAPMDFTFRSSNEPRTKCGGGAASDRYAGALSRRRTNPAFDVTPASLVTALVLDAARSPREWPRTASTWPQDTRDSIVTPNGRPCGSTGRKLVSVRETFIAPTAASARLQVLRRAGVGHEHPPQGRARSLL
jgi:methylthioribose-1-phosphate isomerase